jgi:hypothetical protein
MVDLPVSEWKLSWLKPAFAMGIVTITILSANFSQWNFLSSRNGAAVSGQTMQLFCSAVDRNSVPFLTVAPTNQSSSMKTSVLFRNPINFLP